MTRVDPPLAAGERDMLIAFLDYQRETMVAKAEGLNEEQARFRPTGQANSLISLISHLAWVERWWFQGVFRPGEIEFPWSDDDPDADFKVPDDRPLADVVAFYREGWERSNEIARGVASLDEESSKRSKSKGAFTLRWILVHMIEETARHAGHADLTREMIDGSVGE